MTTKLDTGSVKSFLSALRDLTSARLAQTVASYAAPALTTIGKADFAQQQAPSGVPWASSVDGTAVTLVRSGSLRDQIRYVAIGRIVRVALGVNYAKYQIGKRPVFPARGSALPTTYQTALRAATERATEEWRIANSLDRRD